MTDLELLQSYFPNTAFRKYEYTPNLTEYKTNSSDYDVELSVHYDGGFKYHIYIAINDSPVYNDGSNDLKSLLELSKQYLVNLQLKLEEFVIDVMKISR